MAGHSQFKNIMHRKGAQDKKRARTFSKIAREITVAAKSGQLDPAVNPRLRSAIASAREANMPNDRIKRAIEQANPNSGEAANYDEVRYEGYGPGGVAVIIEALTDNRNRTAGEVRLAFTKNGCALGETNSVSFMFAKVGSIAYPASIGFDALFETSVEAGAENVEAAEEVLEVTTQVSDFAAVREVLEKAFGAPLSAGIIWKPGNTVPIAGDAAHALMDLIEALEDLDDVQNVFANFEMDAATLTQLAG